MAYFFVRIEDCLRLLEKIVRQQMVDPGNSLRTKASSIFVARTQFFFFPISLKLTAFASSMYR